MQLKWRKEDVNETLGDLQLDENHDYQLTKWK